MNTAKQLLQRLEFLCIGSEDPDLHKDIEAYLAKQQVEQEPVGEVTELAGSDGGFSLSIFEVDKIPVGTKLYTSPQAREPMSEDEIYKAFKYCRLGVNGCTEFARAIEAHHGIK